jgi:hypothetical protein
MADKANPNRPALQEALDAVKGEPALRQQLNERGWSIKSRNVIAQWLANGVPPKYCPDIEALTGVTCERLCPEVKWGLVRDRRNAARNKPRTSTHATG